jgi:hypothetical protein
MSGMKLSRECFGIDLARNKVPVALSVGQSKGIRNFWIRFSKLAPALRG